MNMDSSTEVDLGKSDVTFAGMDLQEFPQSIMGNGASIERLGLQQNLLHHLPESFHISFMNLRNLNIKSNQFTEFPLVLCQMKWLEILDVSRNRITELPKDFGSLINLKALSLSKNEIQVLPEYFSKMNQLKILKVDCNPLRYPPLNVLKKSSHEKSDAGQVGWLSELQQWIREHPYSEYQQQQQQQISQITDYGEYQQDQQHSHNDHDITRLSLRSQSESHYRSVLYAACNFAVTIQNLLNVVALPEKEHILKVCNIILKASRGGNRDGGELNDQQQQQNFIVLVEGIMEMFHEMQTLSKALAHQLNGVTCKNVILCGYLLVEELQSISHLIYAKQFTADGVGGGSRISTPMSAQLTGSINLNGTPDIQILKPLGGSGGAGMIRHQRNHSDSASTIDSFNESSMTLLDVADRCMGLVDHVLLLLSDLVKSQLRNSDNADMTNSIESLCAQMSLAESAYKALIKSKQLHASDQASSVFYRQFIGDSNSLIKCVAQLSGAVKQLTRHIPLQKDVVIVLQSLTKTVKHYAILLAQQQQQ
ncbi:hypothetical protein MIR68_006394 [Amoeboaphelidium protococcarum]|nr:hypothetical protein MIR68_006394 [Amoeboaphelidium protococcarum]